MGDPPKIENVTQEYWNGHFTAWQSVLSPELESIFMDSAELMMAEWPGFGVDWGMVNQGAADWARDYVGQLIRGIDDTTQRGVRDAVERFYSEGENLGALRERLARWYGPMRADMIATTEVTRAAVEGERGTAAELAKEGIVMVEVWKTNNDELVCTICGPLNGKRKGDGWTERDGPPAHPRCRCWTSHELPKVERVEEAVAIGKPPRFGNKAEAGQWIRDNLLANPGAQFARDFEDMSPAQLQTLADVLAEEKQKHGLMFDMILPTSAKSNAFAWVQNHEVLGEQHTNLTLTFAGADEEIAKRRAQALSAGFVTEENYADVIRHEYGHLVLHNNKDLAMRAEELYRSQPKGTWVRMSRYAAENYHEMFAESYSVAGRNWMADKVLEALGL